MAWEVCRLTDIQMTLFEMLIEIDGICKRNNIEYYLHGNTAFSAVKDKCFTEEICHAEVAMNVKNLLKFMEAFKTEAPKGRSLESWLTNSSYGEFGARYVNENTLFLDLPNSHSYKFYGFGVRINVLRDTPASRITSKAATVKEIGWEMNFKDGNPSAERKALFCKSVVESQLKKTDAETFAKKMFWEFCRIYDNPSAKICFTKQFRTRRYHFNKSIFENASLKRLENYEFPVPVSDGYFKTLYGSDWKSGKPSGRKVTGWVVADTKIPYKEYLETAEESGCSLEQYLEQRRKYNNMQKSGQSKIDTIHHYWDLLFRTGDRYDLWEMYYPIKDELIALRKDGRYDELQEALKDYISLTYKNYKLGLGLCFDPEILECMLDVFKYEDNEEYAQKVRALIPEEHMKPIVIKGYEDE